MSYLNHSDIKSVFYSIGGENASDSTLTWNYIAHQYWEDAGDPRTVNFPLFTNGPALMMLIMSSYLLFVTIIGPRIMKNRSPFELRKTMLAYNIIIIVINFVALIRYIQYTNFGRNLFYYTFPPKNDFSARTLEIINFGWYYYLSKYLDLLDTVFFVLRKKHKQITTLHVYHHTTVPVLGWFAIKLGPTVPAVLMFTLLNSFVHTIMYFYYALTAFGSKFRNYLWLKRHITQIQLLQFVVFMFYGCNLALNQSGYPRFWFWLTFVQNPLFFLWFYDFYRNSYTPNNKKID